MNTGHPETKVGLLDLEINKFAKVRTAIGPQFLLISFQDPLHRNFRAVTSYRRL